MRRRLIFLTLSLVLAGAGPSFAAEGQAPKAPPAVHKTTQSKSFVVIEPIYTTILEGTTPRGLLLVELGLDVPDNALREKVARALPLLRDAFLRNLTVYAATSVRPWRQPSVEDIAGRMQAITDRVMGASGARVLMAQTAIRITR